MGKAPFYLAWPAKRREPQQVEELRMLAEVLYERPELLALVQADLEEGAKEANREPAMDALQVQRCLVLKQMQGYSYGELAFKLQDSISSRGFCLIEPAVAGIGEQMLREQLEQVKDESWARIDQVLRQSCGRLWKKKYSRRLRQ